jgi:hypothetical protein
MQHAIDEFGKLSAYCEERFGQPARPRKVELAKIDLIERGRHWRDLEHLRTIMPITGTFSDVHRGGSRELALRFVENDPPRTLTISVNSVSEKRGADLNAIRIETRAIGPVVDGGLEGAFAEANTAVNGAFFTLIGDEGRRVFGATQGGE